MVQTIHPSWRNRSCFRFGIYSEALDEELTNNTKAKNRRVRYGVVAGMIIVATILVSQMSVLIYDMMSLLGFRYILLSLAFPGGWFGGFKPPRNSEVLKKLGQIPSSVEYTSVTT
jgi:hypothetical protein